MKGSLLGKELSGWLALDQLLRVYLSRKILLICIAWQFTIKAIENNDFSIALLNLPRGNEVNCKALAYSVGLKVGHFFPMLFQPLWLLQLGPQ